VRSLRPISRRARSLRARSLHPAAAAALVAALAWSCGRSDQGGPLPGDSLADVPEGPPVAGRNAEGAESPPDRAAAGPEGESVPAAPGAAPDPAPGAGGVCPSDNVFPERLPLEAAWKDGHVRVTGTIPAGAGKTLNLSLSQGERFVVDEIFRGERLASLRLRSEAVDVTSEAYTPSESEQVALARTGAIELDRGAPVCVTASLYDGLTLVSIKQIPLTQPGA